MNKIWIADMLGLKIMKSTPSNSSYWRHSKIPKVHPNSPEKFSFDFIEFSMIVQYVIIFAQYNWTLQKHLVTPLFMKDFSTKSRAWWGVPWFGRCQCDKQPINQTSFLNVAYIAGPIEWSLKGKIVYLLEPKSKIQFSSKF